MTAHPFTGFTVVAGTAMLAFLLPAPVGPVILYAVVVVLAAAVGTGRSALRAVLVSCRSGYC